MTFHSLDTAWSALVTYHNVINFRNAKNMIIIIDTVDLTGNELTFNSLVKNWPVVIIRAVILR